MGDDKAKAGAMGPAGPFLTKDDLVARMKGTMFPSGKAFAPSLVMWGDPHGEAFDVDRLDHMPPPEDDTQPK